MQQCITANSIDRMQIFFPDPWPKRKHHKRRLIQINFIELVYQKLKLGGHLHLVTDWEDYAKQMVLVISQHRGFYNLVGDNRFASTPDYRPLTKFETRGKKLGHKIWEMIFEFCF